MENLQGKLRLANGVTLRFNHAFLGNLSLTHPGGINWLFAVPGVAIIPNIIQAAADVKLTAEEAEEMAHELSTAEAAQIVALFGHSMGFMLAVLDEMAKIPGVVTSGGVTSQEPPKSEKKQVKNGSKKVRRSR